jgi:hypothetical protein
MAVDIGLKVSVESEHVRQDEAERLLPKKDELEFLKATDGMSIPRLRSFQRNAPLICFTETANFRSSFKHQMGNDRPSIEQAADC